MRFYRFSRRNLFRGTIAVFAVAALVCLMAVTRSGSQPLNAAPPIPKPAPGASASPSSLPLPQPVHTASTAPVASATPAGPTLSAADFDALANVSFHWDVFVQALKGTSGTKLSAAQLAKPTTVVATNLSGCPPGAENRLPAGVRAAVAFCGGEVRVVPEAFNKLNDNEQRRAVASAFIYHALATTTKEQLKFNYNRPRNDAQMLGCLQATMSRAFENFGGGQPEDVWVVMSEKLNGGDVYSAYWATIDWDGEWQ